MTPEVFASTKFDVVIVGGGTAGLVLANRLTDPKHSPPLHVGVIDAGHYSPSGDPAIDIPYGANTYTQDPNAFTIGNPKYDWLLKSEPQPSLDGNVIWYFRGKVLGGSSALHANAWQRSAKYDYDAWGNAFGNGDGWTWDGLLPYFARSETWTPPPSGEDALVAPGTSAHHSSLASVHGKDGALSISYNSHLSDVDRPLTQAMVNLGFPLNDNPDDGDIEYLPRDGIPRTVNPKEGTRSYATSAYYTPEVQSRKNLSVITGAVVSRIVWDKSNGDGKGIRASGVEFVVDGKKYVVNVGKEVILSAGSLKSPQILELSGVGNAPLLEKLGIPVTLNLPQVGENLMDHPVNISDFKVKDGVETLDTLTFNDSFREKQKELYDTKHIGAFTYTPRITGAFPLQEIISSEKYQQMRSELDSTLNDLKLTPLQKAQYTVLKEWIDGGKLGLVTPAMVPRGGMISTMEPNSAYFSVIVFQGHGFSRGSVHINSTDPDASPIINPEFLSLKWDLDVQILANQFVRKWVQTEPAASLVAELHTPSADVQDRDQWATFVKSKLVSMSHPMGTTAMASESLGGVVDNRLKVYGLENVRVVDAGIIPMTLSTPIQPAVYALAEKGADLILEDLGSEQVISNSRKYPMRTLGPNGPAVSAIGFGTMGIGAWYGEPKSETEALELIDSALAAGHTLIDTSDCYGTAEAMVGKWLAKNPSRRSEIFLCTKFGACNFVRSLVDDFVPESDPGYIKVALYRSLYMLKTDYIDLYYQHRVDPHVPIEVVMEALREPLERGIVRYIGLSECSADTLRRAKAVKGVGEKIVAIQVEFSPFSLDIEKNELAATARELGVAIVTYAPLGRGLFSGRYRSRADFAEGDCRLFLPRWTEENFPRNLILVDQMKAIADRLNVSVSQLTLAWILAQDPYWIPIPGGMTVEHIKENAGGALLSLSDEDVKLIRELVEKADNGGERYPVELLGTLYADSLPLDKWTGRKDLD